MSPSANKVSGHRARPKGAGRFALLMPSVAAALLSASFVTACSREEAQQIPAEEATTQIAIAFAAKDRECNMTHNITYPVINRANKDDVAACVASIVASTCASWSAADPTPGLCLVILVDL